jgi:hypothetical protein
MDLTIPDSMDFEVERLVQYGPSSFLTLYDEAGDELIKITELWMVTRKKDFKTNSHFYEIKVGDPNRLYDEAMGKVKFFQYTTDAGQVSAKYTHDGVEEPEAGMSRIWYCKAFKEKFRQNFFQSA